MDNVKLELLTTNNNEGIWEKANKEEFFTLPLLPLTSSIFSSVCFTFALCLVLCCASTVLCVWAPSTFFWARRLKRIFHLLFCWKCHNCHKYSELTRLKYKRCSSLCPPPLIWRLHSCNSLASFPTPYAMRKQPGPWELNEVKTRLRSEQVQSEDRTWDLIVEPGGLEFKNAY